MAQYMDIEIPDNDVERVAALCAYGVLEGGQEAPFDDIVQLAAEITGCQIAYISFFDDKYSRLKARYGIPQNRPDRPRELSLCSPTICQSDLLVVEDLSQHPRYADLPAVQNPPHARFYCAMPLINPEGYALGTLCVWDPRVMKLSPEQQQCIRRLARQLLELLEQRRAIIELKQHVELLEMESAQAEAQIDARHNLLCNVFPEEIAEELIAGTKSAPRYFSNATVVFVDFADFSTLSETTYPRDLIEQLDEYFSRFDEVVTSHGLVKIKTVGDAYMAVAGIIHERADHAERACRAAMEINRLMHETNEVRRKLGLAEWTIRTGVHSGSVIAGRVGKTRTTYDVWGDGVNITKRLQESCEPGRVNISDSTLGLVSRLFLTEERGAIEVKHKGLIPMHYLVSSI